MGNEGEDRWQEVREGQMWVVVKDAREEMVWKWNG